MKTEVAIVEKRKQTRAATQERHAGMDCKMFQVKIDQSHLSKKRKEQIDRLFLEAKWLYNHILAQPDIFKFDTKTTIVQVRRPDANGIFALQNEKLTQLSGQMRQDIHKDIIRSIKMLSTKKKKGTQVGQLHFRSISSSIPLRTTNNSGAYRHPTSNHLEIAKVDGRIRVLGLEQIPPGAEWANAVLVRKPTGLYFHITTFVPKVKKETPPQAIGIDFGIADAITLNDGARFNPPVGNEQLISQAQRKLNKKKTGFKNWWRAKQALARIYEHETNRRKDAANKILHFLTNNFTTQVYQDDSIAGWAAGWFGKQVGQSILGRVKAGLKKRPSTIQVGRFVPTTQLCPKCGRCSKQPLSRRHYLCDWCGYNDPDRDRKSAQCILEVGLQGLTSWLAERKSIEAQPLLGCAALPVEVGASISIKEEQVFIIRASPTVILGSVCADETEAGCLPFW